MPRYDDTFVDRFLEPWNRHDVDGALSPFCLQNGTGGRMNVKRSNQRKKLEGSLKAEHRSNC